MLSLLLRLTYYEYPFDIFKLFLRHVGFISLFDRDRMAVAFINTCGNSAIITKVSWNPAHGEVYSIQHDVIKYVSELLQVVVFLKGTPVSSTNKIHRHDIAKILVLTITLFHYCSRFKPGCIYLP
jgi:hypothetical protein